MDCVLREASVRAAAAVGKGRGRGRWGAMRSVGFGAMLLVRRPPPVPSATLTATAHGTTARRQQPGILRFEMATGRPAGTHATMHEIARTDRPTASPHVKPALPGSKRRITIVYARTSSEGRKLQALVIRPPSSLLFCMGLIDEGFTVAVNLLVARSPCGKNRTPPAATNKQVPYVPHHANATGCKDRFPQAVAPLLKQCVDGSGRRPRISIAETKAVLLCCWVRCGTRTR